MSMIEESFVFFFFLDLFSCILVMIDRKRRHMKDRRFFCP